MQPAPITEDSLTRERNIYLAFWGIVILVDIGFFFAFLPYLNETWLTSAEADSFNALYALAGLVTLAGKATAIYLTARLSRFLRNDTGLTVVYSILVLFALLYLIPLIALLVQVSNTRTKLLNGTLIQDPQLPIEPPPVSPPLAKPTGNVSQAYSPFSGTARRPTSAPALPACYRCGALLPDGAGVCPACRGLA